MRIAIERARRALARCIAEEHTVDETEEGSHAMTEHETWSDLRDRRMSEPDAQDSHDAARLAYELGATVRRLREAKGRSQTELARQASMTQSSVARFEAGGTIRTIPVLQRLAHALGADLIVQVAPHADVA